MNPVKDREFGPSNEEGPLLPPMVKRMHGRHVNKKRREPLEDKNKNRTKLSRRGRVFKCSVSLKGHNKLTWPQKNMSGGKILYFIDIKALTKFDSPNI